MRDATLDLLVDLARPTSHDTVLDFACGAGIAGFAVAADVRSVEAADELSDLLDEGRRLADELGLGNVSFTLVDLYALPYQDGSFSLVVCRNAFHLLPEPGAALAELHAPREQRWAHRGRRPGGRTRSPTRRTTTSPGCASRPTAGTTGRRRSRSWRSAPACA